MATTQEQLDQVRAAIDAIETRGQSYTIQGRTFTRANLDVLYRRESTLMKRLNRDSRGGRIRLRSVEVRDG